MAGRTSSDLHRVWIATLVAYYIGIALSAYLNHAFTTGEKLAYLGLAAAMPLLLEIGLALFHIWVPTGIRIGYNLFTGTAMILGNTLGFYRFVGFDKLLHSTSGVCVAILALLAYGCCFKRVRPLDDRQWWGQVLFINGVNMLIAFLWEVFEFSLLVFFNNDAINHYSQGVYDTMTDMIVCFIGGLVITVSLWSAYRKRREHVLYRVAEDFRRHNA